MPCSEFQAMIFHTVRAFSVALIPPSRYMKYSMINRLLSLILFTATLESIFRRLNWENKGVKIDGEFLSNLRFADDIFLCTETPQEIQQMLQELSDESRRMGLKIHIAKTKVMVVDNTPINVNNVLIENVQGYVYLGQHYSLKEKNQDKEIQRRIMAGWAAYTKHRDIFKSNLAICLKRQVYNSCVLPAMTYGAETWGGIHEWRHNL